MNCMDCQNRPAHRYASTNDAVNLAIALGHLDRTLPYINRSIRLGDRSFNVVGIMPSSVRLFDPAGMQGWDNGFSRCDVWRPLPVDSGLKKQRNYRAFLVLGRLKRGVTVAQVQTGMTRIAEQQARDYPESNSGKNRRRSSLRRASLGSESNTKNLEVAGSRGESAG